MNMQDQSCQAPNREKKKLKVTASAFDINEISSASNVSQTYFVPKINESNPIENLSSMPKQKTDIPKQNDPATQKEESKSSRQKKKPNKIYKEDQFPLLESVHTQEIQQINEKPAEKDINRNNETKSKKTKQKKVKNEWKELNYLKKTGILVRQPKKKNGIKTDEIKNAEETKEQGDSNNAKNKKIWPTPKLNRIRDIIIALYKERNEEDPRNDLKNMANIIKELKKKRKKPSKLKKAKLLYMVKDQISHKNEISTQSTTTKKSKKKIESNEDDGYTTYEEECNGVVTSKQIYDESQKIEEIKDEEMAHQFTAIDPSKLPQIQYNQIKIRNWVDHILCPQIDEQVMIILNRLASIQIKKKIQQPKKFKRRIMCGMREVIRSVDTDVPARLSKCVIVALNIQEIPVKDGPDEKIYSILKKAKEKNIPIIHSCTRRILGYACTGNQSARMSIISIIDYSGLEEDFKNLIKLVCEKKEEFQTKIGTVQ